MYMSRAILNDERIYHDAETFNPDRFMGPNPEPDPTKTGAFGFGRRYAISAETDDFSGPLS